MRCKFNEINIKIDTTAIIIVTVFLHSKLTFRMTQPFVTSVYAPPAGFLILPFVPSPRPHSLRP